MSASLAFPDLSPETLGNSVPRPAMGDLTLPPHRPLRAVAVTAGGIDASWSDGATARLPALWLRDNCPCAACRHPQTMERRWLLIDAPADLGVADAGLQPGGHLAVRFEDGHLSHYDGGWLWAQASDPGGLGRAGAPRHWRGDHRPGRVAHDLYMGEEAGLERYLVALLRDGIAILEGGPVGEEALEEVLRVARRIGEPRGSNFGLVYDVVSKPDPNNSAYTADGLELHSDLTNWRWPPDFQFLYCIANEATGGGSLFADAHAVAEALRVQDPAAFEILSTTPVFARFHDEGCDLRFAAPVIALDAAGQVAAVRFNNWLRAGPGPAEAAHWYPAYRAYWSLLRDPAFRIELKLVAGEMVAFDNARVLHGRRAFDPRSGRRHLQGLYMHRDDLESRLRLLAREEG